MADQAVGSSAKTKINKKGMRVCDWDYDIFPTKTDEKGKFDFAASHDNNLKWMTGKNVKISQLTADQVVKYKITKGANAGKYNEHISLVNKYLNLAKKYQVVSQIELKGQRWNSKKTDCLAKKIKNYKLSGKIQIESQWTDNLEYFRKSAGKYHIKVELTLVGSMISSMDAAKLCKRYRYDNVSVRYDRVSKKMLKYCKNEKIKVGVYFPVDVDVNKYMNIVKNRNVHFVISSFQIAKTNK